MHGAAKSGNGRETPGIDSHHDGPATGAERGAPSSSTSGWAPGATGPVKASHTVTAAVATGSDAQRPQSSAANPLLPSDSKGQAAFMSKHRRVVTPTPGQDSPKGTPTTPGLNQSGTSTGANDSGG